MNLRTTISIYAGGPGSGCNPDKGKCGRKPGSDELAVRTVRDDEIDDLESKWLEMYPDDEDGSVFPLWDVQMGDEVVVFGIRSHRTGAAKKVLQHLQNKFNTVSTNNVVSARARTILEELGFTRRKSTAPGTHGLNLFRWERNSATPVK